MNEDESSANGLKGDPEFSDLLVGDLLWSRVPGYPFWPCMISYDPLQGTFSKVKNSFKSTFVLHHVQYFGETAHRGWTTPRNVILFEGRQKFDKFVSSMKMESENLSSQAKQKLLGKYSVSSSQLAKWEHAVEEAELAMSMSRSERIENFTFIYTMPKNKSANGLKTKPKKEECAENMVDNQTVAKKDFEIIGPRNELMCQICEKASPNVTCNGLCFQSFHLDCLGVLKSSAQFTCDECVSGKHTCFHCKSSDGEVKMCTVNRCGKFYHKECLKKYAMCDVEKFICPLHFCLTCFNDNPRNPRVYRCRLVKCFRCPTAYHYKESCMAAGSFSLCQLKIICPEHFVPAKGKSYQTVNNITWCFICGKVGKLVCCETCPASFHASCLMIDPPEGNYHCDDCVSRKHACYGTIVWVKIGNFRWWPALVKNPKDLPPNILNMRHTIGEFCIQYFGTNEYYWTHRGRAYPYTEEDLFSAKEELKPDTVKTDIKGSSSLQVKYQNSLDEAAAAFDKWAEAKLKELGNEKLPSYKQIKANKPIGKVQILTGDVRSYVKCLCVKGENSCGYSSSCLNRSMMVECHPSVCEAGESCQNQAFQKRQYAQVEPFKTLVRGWALKSLVNIEKGEFIIEYVGDLIDSEECKRRLDEKHGNDDNNYYFLTLDKDRIIDAGPKGNLSRFMNHSCSPNCETQKWMVNGDIRIGLFAKYDITPGTELTFDYMLDSLDNEKLKCLCGATNCRGAIGEKPPKSEPKDTKDNKGKKRKRKPVVRVKKDNHCFRCKKNGKLKRCDRRLCLKAYHISCLECLPPSGSWYCPWHFCDICGKMSRYMCTICPNSYCEAHRTQDLMPLVDFVCPDHDDEEDA